MSNTFGSLFRITTFGESHGAGIGVIIDGCPAGVAVDAARIQAALDRRRPGQSDLTTPRKEADTVHIQSGMFEGVTTGTPISLFIPNADQRSDDYSHIAHAYRASHADYTYGREIRPPRLPRRGPQLGPRNGRPRGRRGRGHAAAGAFRGGNRGLRLGRGRGGSARWLRGTRFEASSTATSCAARIPKLPPCMEARIRAAQAAHDTVGGVITGRGAPRTGRPGRAGCSTSCPPCWATPCSASMP